MYGFMMLMWNSFLSAYCDLRYEWGVAVALLSFVIAMFLVKRQRERAVLRMFWQDWIGLIVFALYMAFFVCGTLLCRNVDDVHQFELRLFWSYWETFVKKNLGLWHQMVYNVLVFIPWGIFLPALFKVKKKSNVIAGATLFSFVIEVIQLIFRLGLFELDDIFHNTIGAVIGYGMWVYYNKIICRNKMKEECLNG